MYTKDEQHHLNQLTEKLVQHSGDLNDKEPSIALRQIINYHDWRHYVLSDPLIADFDYDKLFKELKQIESEHSDLVTQDGPTQRVARALTNEFEQVTHLTSMLSLDNSYNMEDLNDFDQRVKNLTGAEKLEYCVEPKFDGASIALVYEDDMLLRLDREDWGYEGCLDRRIIPLTKP